MEDPEQLSTEEKDDYSEADEGPDLLAEVSLTTQVAKRDFIKTRHGNVRCFPHCSLVHNERTFCGDSVFASIKGLHPGKHAHVLGEFRLKEHEPSLQIGQVVTDEMRKEFLEATLVGRDADEERIRFSFNPPRKWEYKQRPGARDRPDDLHVFTAFGIVSGKVVGMDHTTPFTLTPIWRNQHADSAGTVVEESSTAVDVPMTSETAQRSLPAASRPEPTRASTYQAPFNPLQSHRAPSSATTSAQRPWSSVALPRPAPAVLGSTSSGAFPLISQLDLNKPTPGAPSVQMPSSMNGNMFMSSMAGNNTMALPAVHSSQNMSVPTMSQFGQAASSSLFAPNLAGLTPLSSSLLAQQQQQQQAFMNFAQQQQQQQALMNLAQQQQQQQAHQQSFMPLGQFGMFPAMSSQQTFGGGMMQPQPVNPLMMGVPQFGFSGSPGLTLDQMQMAQQQQRAMLLQQQFQHNMLQQQQQSLFGPPSAWSVDSSKAVSYGQEEEQRQAREMESNMRNGDLHSKKSRADLQQSWN